MIKTITQALFPRKAPTSRRYAGEVWQGNLRARVLVVTDELGLDEYWIELDWYEQAERRWTLVGVVRCERLEAQLDVLRQVTDYLAKRTAAR